MRSLEEKKTIFVLTSYNSCLNFSSKTTCNDNLCICQLDETIPDLIQQPKNQEVLLYQNNFFYVDNKENNEDRRRELATI